MKRPFKYLSGLALVAIAGVALAQSVPIPSANPVTQGDYVQIIKNGAPSAQSVYVPAGTVGSQEQYTFTTPLTGFTLTGANYTSLLYLTPAGTLATGTFTLPALESDGQRFCLVSSQTQTALTVNPSAGQSIVGTAVTALTANVQVCWVYRASNLTWYRMI